MIIGEDGSFNVPEGCDDVKVTCMDPNKSGIYTITGESIEMEKNIEAGETESTPINQVAVKVTNTGYAVLKVEIVS